MPVAKKKCAGCGEVKNASDFYRNNRMKLGLTSYCKICSRHPSRRSFIRRGEKDPAVRIHQSSLSRAIARGIEHSIIVQDVRESIVTHCPYFGIVLDYSRTPQSQIRPETATIDRKDPNKGYVPGNIQIISWKANSLKGRLTPEQLVTLASNILRLHG